MAKKNDFDEFMRDLGAPVGGGLSESFGTSASRPYVSPSKEAAGRVGESARSGHKTTDPSKRQVSHYIDKDLLTRVGIFKAVHHVSVSEIYERALVMFLDYYETHPFEE